MILKELVYFSRQFANMFGIPVRLYYQNQKIYFYTPVNIEIDPVILCEKEIVQKTEEISYYVYQDYWYYGIVSHGAYQFVTGPVSELKLSDSTIKKLGFLLEIPADNLALFISEIKALSGIHLDTLIQAIILYNFTVNRTMYDISDIRIKSTEQKNISSGIKENEISEDMSKFYINHARTFSIEKDIIKKIMNGDVAGLIDGAIKIPAVSAGTLAPHLIRHQKNFFIKLETVVVRAAIDAGLDIDEAFSLEEVYIQKCESLNNIDKIKNLQYHMILDYADRVQKLHAYNKNNSKLVNEVAKYIRNHISEAIKTSDIAEYFGKSRGTISTEFKKNTGMNLSDFIQLKKIQKAQELLCETEKSFVSISNYLGFSSQSHFCRVFKEVTGVTPKEYQKKFSSS